MYVAQSVSSQATRSTNEKARVLLNAGFPNSLLISSEMDFFIQPADFALFWEF